MAAKNEMRSARELAGLTLEQMAEKLGCTKPTVSRIEAHPEKATLAQFAGWYGACNDSGKVLLEKYINDIMLG